MGKRLESLTEIAYKEALKGKGKQRHGAVVVAGGRIIAKACNSYHNRCHAEVRAIKRIPHDLRRCLDVELIVVRATRRKKFGLSKPCSKCQKAIRAANIRAVYYSTDGDVLGFETYGD